MKKTRWFTAAVKPVHKGIYEVDRKDAYPIKNWLMWDGKGWTYAYCSLPSQQGDFADMSGSNRWRGLAEKPQ